VGGYDLVWGHREVLEVGGIGVHVEHAGAGTGPPIVCLHGFASATSTWAGIAPGLARRHRVVAWDRPPFGRSDRPRPRRGPDDPYCLDAELARAAVLCRRLAGDRPAVLVGHSAGALLALQVALAGAVPVAGLVLIAPAVEGAPPAAVRAAARLPGASVAATPALRLGALGATALLRRTARHATPLTEATAADAGACLRRPGTAAALWHLTATWAPPDVLGRLDQLRVPAVVVAGADDRIVRPDAQRAVADALGAELHLLPDAGHAPHEQRPDQVAALVERFVGALDGR